MESIVIFINMVESTAVCAAAFVLLAMMANFSVHKVEEGHVAVYFRVSINIFDSLLHYTMSYHIKNGQTEVGKQIRLDLIVSQFWH